MPSIGAGGDDDLLRSESGLVESGDDDSELDPESLDFGYFGSDREDFEVLKKAILEARMEREGLGDEGSKESNAASTAAAQEDRDALDEDDVKKVEQMMRKLQAVRDASAGLPEEQRKRMAARAVGEVMRDL